MGHYCYVCGKERPNEAFSGKGHRAHICKKCKPITKTQEWKDAQVQNEIYDYMQQKNISKKNQARLQELCNSTNPKIAQLAQRALEYRKPRLQRVDS